MDGGVHWTPINSGLEFATAWAENPHTSDLRRDVHFAISPDFDSDRTVFSGSPAGDGLYVSENRGESWARLAPAIEEYPGPVLAIALSPEFKTDHTVLVSIKGHGLLRSTDRGVHFAPIGEQLMLDNAAIELLEFSPHYYDDRSIIAASDESLFISADQGDTWAEIRRPVRYEDMRNVVVFLGQWAQRNGEQFSALSETRTAEDGSSARLRFVGGGIRWLGSKGPDYGLAQVYIDDNLVASVDSHAGEQQAMQTLFSVQDLEFGAHTIEIRALSRNAGDGGEFVSVDAFDVLPERAVSH